MPVNAKKIPSGGGDFVRQAPMDEGTYPARVVQIINYGLQEQMAFKGESKEPRIEVEYTYEFLDEFCVDENGNEEPDRPRWVTERFPVHNIGADKSKSTKRLKALDPSDRFDGNLLAPIGVPCMVTITKTPAKTNKGDENDKFYNNVSNVSPMREKDAAKAAPLVNPILVFDTDEPNQEVYNSLPEFKQDKLKACLEFNGSALQKMLGGSATPAAKEADKPAPERDEEEKW